MSLQSHTRFLLASLLCLAASADGRGADYHLNGQTNLIADPAAKPIKAVLA